VIAEAFNVTAGAYNLTATWSAETSQFACVSSQIANVIAADGREPVTKAPARPRGAV